MSSTQLQYKPSAYRPSVRMAQLRQRAMAHPAELGPLGGFRPYFYLEGWHGAAGLSLSERNGAALAQVIANMPTFMVAGELLVGEHGNGGDLCNFRARFPDDYAPTSLSPALSEAQRARMTAWVQQQPFAWMPLGGAATPPAAYTTAHEQGLIAVWGTDLNHSIRDYAKVLRLGFAGILAEVQQALAAIALDMPDASERRANLLAFAKICEAALTLGTRHAAQARELAAACADPGQRAEWEAIAEVCTQVPAQPARTFREALQALWFAHMMTVWEDGVNANGIGRIDQFLWPYLERDLADGRITWDDAAELLAALWVKLYQDYDVQQMMIGGQTVQGEDATNPLSYLVLDVTEGLEFVRCLSARLHTRSPRAFVARCLDLVAKGGGIPFFFNDEALIPALTSHGIPLADARDYAAIGCIEITIPGKANPHAVSHWINLAKCLELALNDGRDLRDATQVGPHTGTLVEHQSMDDIWQAFTTQLRYAAELAVYGSNAAEHAHRQQYRLPYLSLLTEDCVANGRDIIEGGARYNYHSSAAMGIPNVADSLAALAQAVYREGHVGREQLLTALRNNYAGEESLRQYLRNKLPKYGNDEELPDQYAADIARHYCELLGSYATAGGGTFFTHLFTYTMMLAYGKSTGASPDGRLAGEPLAYSVSPVQGRDKVGFTAVLNSLSRIPHHLVAASSSAILEVDPSLLAGAGREAFVDLISTAIQQGVGQLQFNVVSADTLRAAQAQPDQYRNLCVRVSGFSQQFLLLDQEMQEHIIARTKHRR
ncbi:MAG TPA: pyruvate formate lyase family protein [Armatimonadota bacterium]